MPGPGQADTWKSMMSDATLEVSAASRDPPDLADIYIPCATVGCRVEACLWSEVERKAYCIACWPKIPFHQDLGVTVATDVLRQSGMSAHPDYQATLARPASPASPEAMEMGEPFLEYDAPATPARVFDPADIPPSNRRYFETVRTGLSGATVVWTGGMPGCGSRRRSRRMPRMLPRPPPHCAGVSGFESASVEDMAVGLDQNLHGSQEFPVTAKPSHPPRCPGPSSSHPLLGLPRWCLQALAERKTLAPHPAMVKIKQK